MSQTVTVTVMGRANVQRVDASRPSSRTGHRIIEGGASVGGVEEPSGTYSNFRGESSNECDIQNTCSNTGNNYEL